MNVHRLNELLEGLPDEAEIVVTGGTIMVGGVTIIAPSLFDGLTARAEENKNHAGERFPELVQHLCGFPGCQLDERWTRRSIEHWNIPVVFTPYGYITDPEFDKHTGSEPELGK